MIRRGALMAISSSGGKDSQAMTILLARTVPRDQMVVVHAPLSEVEWPGTVEHIENTIPAGVPLILAPVASARSKRIPWARSDRNSRAGREWFDWLPIFNLSTDDVFRVIRDAGQSPHWVYAQGMSRCSCSFCIFSSRSDLRRAAELRPDLYQKYSGLEKRIGHTLSPSRIPLPELTGIPIDPTAGTPGPSSRFRTGGGAGP